jgi:carbonic anhydrase/acetyltransferase-like protein (isoleucine patch superfamily)
MKSLKERFPHRYINPKIDPTAFIAPGSHLYGDVEMAANTSLWFNAVIRGDVNFVRIGKETNIQDLSLVHVSSFGDPAIIGERVTVGHSAIIHACKIGNDVLIGMGAVVMDGAEIGDFVILGAGSLVTQGMKIPSGVKAFGRPAKVVGPLSEAERKSILDSAERYVALSRTYL